MTGMSKRAIKIFTVIGIISVVFRLLSLLSVYYTPGYYILSTVLDATGQVLFLSMLLFVKNDLKNNYGKGVWPVYLFICATAFVYITNISGVTSTSITIFLQLLFFVVIVIFISCLLKTVYRLFAFAFIISILLSVALRYILSAFLPSDNYRYWLLISLIPDLYPLVLIYIVHTKNNTLIEDEINSIGSDIAES